MSERTEPPDWDSNEELYSSLFENGHDFTFLLESNGNVVEVSERALSFAGAKRNEIIETRLWTTPWFQTASDHELKEDIQRACGGKTIKTEYRIAGRNRVTDVQLVIRPIPGTQDDAHFIFVTGVDITQYLKRISELEEYQQFLEEFISVVTHDLRTFIHVASGYVELATDRTESTELEKASAALGRASELFDHVSATVKQGSQIGDRSELNLAIIAKEAWENVEGPDASLDIESTMAVNADRIRLLEVFENLYRNAIEHAGPDVAVRVGVQNGGFYVEDDGPGIDPSAEYVFEPGKSTSADGMGLGLAIVETIVTAHGWSIEAKESHDGGARFEINT